MYEAGAITKEKEEPMTLLMLILTLIKLLGVLALIIVDTIALGAAVAVAACVLRMIFCMLSSLINSMFGG